MYGIIGVKAITQGIYTHGKTKSMQKTKTPFEDL